MNLTLPYLGSRIRAYFATRKRAIRKLVRAELQAGPQSDGSLSQGQQALAAACSGPRGNFGYFLAPTAVAAALALASGIGAYLIATAAQPGFWTLPMAGVLAALCALCLYQAVGRRFGPALIDAARYAQAVSSLQASGDGYVRPLSVLLIAAMALLFMLDGTFIGITLATNALGSILSPRLALLASLAWSGGLAWLLYHFTHAAARECAINQRRALLRHLLVSPRSADRQRGEAMIERIGHVLGNDYSEAANRIRARVTLAVVVLALAAATFVVRVRAEMAEISAEPVAATSTVPGK